MHIIKTYTGTWVQRKEKALDDLITFIGPVKHSQVQDYLVSRLLLAQDWKTAMLHTRFVVGSIKMLAGVNGFPIRAFVSECIGLVKYAKRQIKHQTKETK